MALLGLARPQVHVPQAQKIQATWLMCVHLVDVCDYLAILECYMCTYTKH